MTRCVNTSSADAFHPGELEWEDGKAYCPRCLRYRRAIAKRRHPSVLPPIRLAPVDPSRCHHHDRPDRLACPECIANREDR